jgi:hypothetical protein
MKPHFRQSVRRAIRRSPRWNWALRYIVPRYRERAVTNDTEIVIEGFPRCANTFAVVAFRLAQARDVAIAHHLHSLGQIRRGVERRIPTLVIVRTPSEAILSFAVRRQIKDIQWAVDEYLDFHQGIVELGDSIMLAEFHEVTRDFGAVIRRLNRRFQTSFAEFVHTEQNVAACFEQIDLIERSAAGSKTVRTTHVARPSDERNKLRQAYAEQLREPELQTRLAQAEQLFTSLCRAHAIALPLSPAQT